MWNSRVATNIHLDQLEPQQEDIKREMWWWRMHQSHLENSIFQRSSSKLWESSSSSVVEEIMRCRDSDDEEFFQIHRGINKRVELFLVR